MRKFILVLIAATVPLAEPISCASTHAEKTPRGAAQFADDARLGEEVKNVCFSGLIDGFGDTTRDTVVLTKGISDRYLVEVIGGCQNLNFAQGIGVESRSSCLSRGDRLIVSETAFPRGDVSGLGPQRCTISKIYKWNKDADEKA